MKKILLFLFVLIMVLSLSAADFEKGVKGLGGGISFSSYKYNNESPTTTTYNIGPRFSYFVLKNLCLDLDVSYGAGWDNGNSGNNASVSFGIGGRYFYKNFYGGLKYDYSYGRGVYDQGFLDESRNWYWGLTFKAGYMIPFRENIFLDLGLAYNTSRYKSNMLSARFGKECLS